MKENLKLIEPAIEFDRAIQAFRAQFLFPGMSMDGGGGLIRLDDTKEWLRRVAKARADEATLQYIYLRETDGKVVGVIQIRLRLDDTAQRYSGHIGYAVAPSERRKGYATQMLTRALEICRESGLARVLVCCLKDNEASRRTIKRCGGVYESTVYQSERDRYLERYWIKAGEQADDTCRVSAQSDLR